ncbi:MAG TPA: ABC transporter permease [Thermomicrobiales bacterium]|nr:ABC transporter permease [Thermomicrobiales bacterium]
MDLRRIFLVVRRELLTRLQQRSYRLTMLFQVIVVAVFACLPVIIAAFSDEGSSMSTVLVIDADGTDLATRLQPYVSNPEGSGDTVELVTSTDSAESVTQQVRDGDVEAALIATRDEHQNLAFTYTNAGSEADNLSQQIYVGAAAISLEDRLSRIGIDQATFETAIAPPSFTFNATTDVTNSDDDEFSGVEVALAYFFTILMFMAIILYGSWVAGGVVEEKSTRIMEIMINAATPRDLLAGKVIGIGAAGLLQMLPMLIVGGVAFGLQRRIARALDISTSSLPSLDFGSVSLVAVGWFLVYFLLGFTLYAAMYAGLASLVSRQEEVNQAIAPMQTISTIGYIAAFVTMWAPGSVIAQVLSIFPLTSPFVMISRVIVGDPPAWELALSVILLLATMVGAILVAARIYRVGVLQYGQKPSLRAVFSPDFERSAR